MPIEFRCQGCGRLLRTADDTAGKQAKCPQCDEILSIPTSTPPEADQTPVDGLNHAASREASSDPFTPSETSSSNPYQTPTTTQVAEFHGHVVAAAGAKLTPTAVDFGDLFTRSWNIFQSQLGVAVLFGLCVLGVQITGNIVMVPIGLAAQFLATQFVGNPEVAAALSQFLHYLLSIIVEVFITCISVRFALDLMRGHASPLGAMWNVVPYFLRVLGFQLLIVLVGGVLIAVCAIPVIIAYIVQDESMILIGAIITGVLAIPTVAALVILALMVFLTSFFIIDRGEGVIEALQNSIHYMKGNKLTSFLVLIIVTLAAFGVTVFTCCIGTVLFVTPYMALLTAVLYVSATGQWVSRDTNTLADESPFEQPGF